MTFLLESLQGTYEILFAHQADLRTFNRGAMKNLGFLAIKAKYPQHYQDITFVFNDVDTMPFAPIFDYQTQRGIVKHYYGYQYALGGIVVIKGFDFERINGFPCYWGWGGEDNVLQLRCQRAHLVIDRSHFYPIGSPHILQLFDGISRIVNRNDPWRSTHDTGIDGLSTLHQIVWFFDKASNHPPDNEHVVDSDHILYVNVTHFSTYIPFEADNYYHYDLRDPPRKILAPQQQQPSTISGIPFRPTELQQLEQQAITLQQQQRPIPPALHSRILELRRQFSAQEDRGIFGPVTRV